MKSLKDFDRLYYNTLYPDLKRLEAERKQVAKTVTLTWVLGSLIILFLAYLVWPLQIHAFPRLNPILLPLALSIFLFWVVEGLKANYNRQFKEKIITKMITAFDKKLIYAKFSCVGKRHFVASELFDCRGLSSDSFLNNPLLETDYENYKGSDYVAGLINNVPIEFSQLCVEKKVKKETSTIFKGMFIWAEFNKYFEGQTFVSPNGVEAQVKNLIPFNLDSQVQRINLEDMEFEKYFVVHATDQIEARYILTPFLMQELANLRKKLNRPFRISFVRSRIYLAISESTHDIFEPPLYSSLLDFQNLKSYFEVLVVLTNIVEALRLDTQIWGKQIQVTLPPEAADASIPESQMPLLAAPLLNPRPAQVTPESDDTRLDLNQASVEEIESLPGIDLRLARIALKLRTEYGGFQSVDAFLDLLGLDPIYHDRIHKAATVKPISDV